MGLALGLRLWRYLSADLGRDTAICGLMGLSVLHGDFLLFFFGQKFMGSLDAYLSAPIYLFLTPSVLTANLLPAFLSLATVFGLYLLLRRHFSPIGSLTGLLFAAVPTAISLYWVTQGKPFYHLAMFFSVLLIHLTLKLVETSPKPCGAHWLAWGLLSGLIFWVNFLFGVVIAACALTLLWGLKGRFWGKHLREASVGAVFGLAPLIIFFLVHGRPNLGIIPPGERFTFLDRLALIFFNSLPIVLGLTPPVGTDGLSLQSWIFPVFLLLLLVLILAAAGLLIRGLASPGKGLLLPLFLVGFNLGAAFLGGRPQDYRFPDQRYFTPLYLALPFFWAFLAERLNRRRLAFTGWLVFLLAVHISGYGSFRAEEKSPLLGIKTGFYFNQEKIWSEQIRALRNAGIESLYFDDFGFAFLADWHPRVSSLIMYEDYKGAAWVDGSWNPGFSNAPPTSFQLLGLDHRILAGGVRHSFTAPRGTERLLDRSQWKISGLDGRKLGNVLNDGDLVTVFQTSGSDPEGQGFTLDLGREETAGGFALILSDYRQVPAGLRIEAAGPNEAFETIREVRDYFGPAYLSGPHPFIAIRYPRIDAYFPPQPLRYLRLTQVGRIAPDWSVNEILLFGPDSRTGAIPWPQATEMLLKTMTAYPLSRLYADAWPSAVIYSRLGRPPRLLLPNQNTDPFGSRVPHPSEPLILDPAPGNGLLILNREALMVSSRLDRSGIRYDTIPAGNYTLFLLNGRIESPSLKPVRITSDQNPGEAGGLIRGLPLGQRWSTGIPQRPGLSLTIDLGKIQPIQSLKLECPRFPQDYPRGLAAFYSLDGLRWKKTPLHQAEPLVFTGQLLLQWRGPIQRYRLDPGLQARYLRLTLSESDPVYWWSVEEIRISGPPAAKIGALSP